MKNRLCANTATCFLVALCLFSSPALSKAALYAYQGYALLNNNGGGNTYYDLDFNTANPNFAGSTFTVNYGQTLLLGAQVKTDPGGGNPSSWGADWARIYYQINGGSVLSLNLPAIAGNPGTDWYVQFEQANTANMVDIANGLGIGNYSLVVWIQAHDNTQPADGYVSNGGLNFNATISVVPEPTTLALGIFGVLGGCGGVVQWWRNRRPIPA